ncbi:MAG: ion transporter [Gammaproteobacteria bacterium]|nr:MAG: ion transporter [Gammaproteobacteria bacterium]
MKKSLKVRNDTLRSRASTWIESHTIQLFIISLIIINAVVLGLETDAAIMSVHGEWLSITDHVILSVFVVEIAIKLYAYRLGFFRNAWNVFDFIVIGIALIPSSGPLEVLRALRVLRVLRLVSMMPQLRMVVEALLKAIPGISSVAVLMLVLFYVFAVMATTLFGQSFPQWFGSIGNSMYTLFQIMTLESWSMGIVRPVMESHPYAWTFFIPFILIATFTMLNLFIGIIVNTMQTIHEAQLQEEQDHIEATVHTDIGKVSNDIQDLHAEIRLLRTVLEQQTNR